MIRERAPLPGLYGNVGQIYHSGLTVQFSYLPRAACRSTPNHPRAPGADGSGDGGCECGGRRTGGNGGSGAEAPDRGSANTLSPPHPHSRPLSLFLPPSLPPSSFSYPSSSPLNLLFPSNLPQPRVEPSFTSCTSFSFLDLRQRSGPVLHARLRIQAR